MPQLSPLTYVIEVAKIGSIRKAAEVLAITPSALNRRILALEEELGVPIFERLARGVRLNTAGEILVHHIRAQASDIERVRSQIADLAGVRRGHIAIACSQALLPYFMPREIERYRGEHPAVTFSVHLRDREAAERSIFEHEADIAVVFEPTRFGDFHTILTVRQPVCAIMAADHPLADQKSVRLREVQQFPLALPQTAYGVRYVLDASAARLGSRMEPMIESDSFEFLVNYGGVRDLVSFQIPIGLPPKDRFAGKVAVPLDARDVPPGLLYLGHLRDRTLPVAAARFADQLANTFVSHYDYA